MNKFTKQFADAANNWKSLIDASVTTTTASVENAKKIANIQCEAISDLVEHTAKTTKELCTTTCPVEASNVVKDFVASTTEKFVANCQNVYQVLARSHASYKDVATSSFKNANEVLLNTIGKASDVNPAWSKAAKESVETAINAASQANATLNKVAVQVSELANKNIRSATAATLNTMKKAATSAKASSTVN